MKFKKGDKVKCNVRKVYSYVNLNEICEVREVEGNKMALIDKADGEIVYNVDDFELVKEESNAPAFLEGDIVEAFGHKGVVSQIYPDRVEVKFETENGDKWPTFLHNGKQMEWHKEPSLKLLERPVKEVSFEAKVVNNGFPVFDKVENMKTVLSPFINKKVLVTVKVIE